MSKTTIGKVFCFGEVLWDVFTEGKKPGGAPMNVAYHLSRANIPVAMISRVGDDELGREIMILLKEWNIGLENISCDPVHPTGSVIATIDEKKEAHYQILEHVAWDFIEIPHQFEEIKKSKAFVYGSLAARNEKSKETLLKLLKEAPFKVFDVNLRAPFFSGSLLEELIKNADLVKMNEAELKLILEQTGRTFVSETESVTDLMQIYGLSEVIITKGAKGATVYKGKDSYSCPVISIDIKDTVGSGDSFLAGYLSGKLKGLTIEETLVIAVTLSGFVTEREGACPPYTKEQLELFRSEKASGLLERVKRGSF